MDTDNLVDAESIKKGSAFFVLKLREGRCLSQVAVDDVVQGCEGIVEQTLSHAKTAVTQAGTDVDMDGAFELPSPFTGLRIR